MVKIPSIIVLRFLCSSIRFSNQHTFVQQKTMQSSTGPFANSMNHTAKRIQGHFSLLHITILHSWMLLISIHLPFWMNERSNHSIQQGTAKGHRPGSRSCRLHGKSRQFSTKEGRVYSQPTSKECTKHADTTPAGIRTLNHIIMPPHPVTLSSHVLPERMHHGRHAGQKQQKHASP